MPRGRIPYCQLTRLDRPVGYWLLTLPGWIALTLASYGSGDHDFGNFAKWAGLILIGAIAMRGAGCTYNDIVDRDLDAKVDRTALRPIPAGTVKVKQAWIWLLAQCLVGLMVLLFLPRLAQIVSLCSIPLVAAYPFMKRITWWPQVWLGLTFNWAALVAYAAMTDTLSPSAVTLYLALVFWTVGYDTIYACQDIEDDAIIGVKSTARRFGRLIKQGVATNYLICSLLLWFAFSNEYSMGSYPMGGIRDQKWTWGSPPETIFFWLPLIFIGFFILHLMWQIWRFDPEHKQNCLKLFKSNFWAGLSIPVAWFGLISILSLS